METILLIGTQQKKLPFGIPVHKNQERLVILITQDEDLKTAKKNMRKLS